MQEVIDRLTERQTACLLLVAQGYTSKEIGRRLGISPTTVDNHVRTSLSVLQVESRAEAARLVVQRREAVPKADDTSVPAAPAAGHGQPLTSQAPELAPVGVPAATSWSEGGVPEPRPRSVGTLLPPLGGHLHDLGLDQRLFAILRVAVFGLATLIVLTLAAAALLWALR